MTDIPEMDRREKIDMNSLVIQIILICVGLVILILSLLSLARKNLEPSACVTWGFISFMFVLAGIVLRPKGLLNMMSPAGLIMLVIVGICIFVGAFDMSIEICRQKRRNNELSMQISLLNMEMEEMQKRIEEMEKQLEENKTQ